MVLGPLSHLKPIGGEINFFSIRLFSFNWYRGNCYATNSNYHQHASQPKFLPAMIAVGKSVFFT